MAPIFADPPSSDVGIVVNSIEGLTSVGDERHPLSPKQQVIARGPLIENRIAWGKILKF